MDSSQKQSLADRAGTKKSYLSKVAHGHRLPSIDLIKRLQAVDKRIHVGMFV